MNKYRHSIAQIVNALECSWSAKTIYPELSWSQSNPARGQCVVSALVVQDYFGGDFKRYEVEFEGGKEKHFINLLENGERLDVTGKQYGNEAVLIESPVVLHEFRTIRDKLLHDESTLLRYELLKKLVSDYLIRQS